MLYTVRPHKWCLVAGLCTLLVAASALATPQKPATPQSKDDPTDAEAEKVFATRLVRENCLICHGTEMIATQRLTPKQWKAEVEKMVGWGSPLPPEHQERVIAYLSSEYPDKAPPAHLDRMTIAAADGLITPEPEGAAEDEVSAVRGASAYAKQCANCHGATGQGSDLGPNLVEKPVLYRLVEYRSIVREGQNRMPGFAASLKPADELDILAWLRDRQFEPPQTAGR